MLSDHRAPNRHAARRPLARPRQLAGFAGHLSVLLASAFLAACGDRASQRAADPLRSGPYPVGVTRVDLFDEARSRPLRVEVWYPADESVRQHAASPIADFVDASLAPLLAGATVQLVAVRDAPIAPDAPFPLIAFSHGNGGVRFQNTFQTERLASHGFVVIAPDHTGNSLFDLGADPNPAQSRPIDIQYLYSTFTGLTGEPGGRFGGWIDTSRRFGVTGHSLGALTSFIVASTDARVGASLPMAAPGPISATYDAPTLAMLATQDKTLDVEINQLIRGAYGRLPGPRYLVELADAGHYSFTIACLTGTGLGDGDGCGESERYADGSRFTFTPAERVWEVVNGYSVALFGRYLRGTEAYEETLTTNLAPEFARLEADLRTVNAMKPANAATTLSLISHGLPAR